MRRKPTYRPSALTVLGIYARHVCGKLGVSDDDLNEITDIMPPAPGLISFSLPAAGPLTVLGDPEFWKDVDSAASRELDQPVHAQLEGATVTIITGS